MAGLFPIEQRVEHVLLGCVSTARTQGAPDPLTPRRHVERLRILAGRGLEDGRGLSSQGAQVQNLRRSSKG